MPPPAEQTPCPYCACPVSFVVDVRRHVNQDGAVQSWRRRRCGDCARLYTTLGIERVVGHYAQSTLTIEITTTSRE